MSAVLADTSVLVRYLTGDPLELAATAALLLDGEDVLTISDLVLAETAHVLARLYGVEREPLLDALAALVGKRNILLAPTPKPMILESLALCRGSSRVSVPDALLWAQARHTGAAVFTFDRRFPREGVEVRFGPEP